MKKIKDITDLTNQRKLNDLIWLVVIGNTTHLTLARSVHIGVLLSMIAGVLVAGCRRLIPVLANGDLWTTAVR